MNLRKIIDDHIFTEDLSTINLEEKKVINTVNPHSYCVSKTDDAFSQALLNSDILLPDGSGIVLATKILRGKTINKIAGADIHKHLLEYADKNNKKVFYLGAAESTLKLIKERISKEYLNIKVESYSPPYKSVFSEEDTSKMISKVNDFEPDILFVGMTAPKQEKWVASNKDKLKATITVSIGAVFDFYAGTVERSSPFWIKIGLEWLPRLIKEPKRLWRRNFVSTPLFLWFLFKAKFKINQS
ncbi:WecB/TagA/CpsF family glycosyltransferase [uncultured Polaribacter sp.]|uniref:WecB/TagA/CpsF family glycosyltransferase n=1 Tax=uncultured Polaribacter sp. TaxID=174711 RepID=UPI00263742C5|nr:WecB/TagA/CpsF family glycosyltransferase [uncultured Polaribacter sp.]